MREKTIMEKTKAQLGSAMFAKAAECSDVCDAEYEGPEPSTEICAAVRAYTKAVDDAFDAHQTAVYSIKSSKYELFATYATLIEELYHNVE